MMKVSKYRCRQCEELFETLDLSGEQEVRCPRCGSEEIADHNVCLLEAGPPPWEFQCQECKTRFRVQSPSGPDEVKQLRCPVCRSKNIKWLALSTAACGTGG